MSELLRRICLLSAFLGSAVSLIPEKGIKQITEILCTCLIIAAVLECFKGFDWEFFSSALAVFRENEKVLVGEIDDTRNALDRAVIEEEYASYIFDKAENKGVLLEEVKVEVKQSAEGIWIPWKTYIECKESTADTKVLSEMIEAELGIPKERQVWTR